MSGQAHHLSGMVHVDMRKLPAAAQEERRRQVVALQLIMRMALFAAVTALNLENLKPVILKFAAIRRLS